MCLERSAGASPSAPTPHRPVRGRVPGRSASGAAVMSATATTRYPRGKRWRLDDLDHPVVALAGAPRAEHSFSLPSLPQRSLGGIDRPSPQRGGKHIVTSFPPETGDFTDPFRRRGLPPRSVSAQLRTGRHHGKAVRENSPPPRRDPRDPPGPAARRRDPRVLTPRARTSLHHRCTEPHNSSRKRRTQGGRAAHQQGSTPRYRAGHHPLPGGSTGVEAPLYPAEPGRAPHLTTADSPQQATTTLPAAAEHTSERDDGARTRRLLSKPLLAGHIVVHEYDLTPDRKQHTPSLPPRDHDHLSGPRRRRIHQPASDQGRRSHRAEPAHRELLRATTGRAGRNGAAGHPQEVAQMNCHLCKRRVTRTSYNGKPLRAAPH
jgi:hypothetical protein